MMPKDAASLNFSLFTVALLWLKDMNQGNEDEDDIVRTAHKIVTDTISDSDTVREIERIYGQNVRDKLTVKEMERLNTGSSFK